MSKSLGNYIGINEPPGEQFGKLMSISDDLMWRYFELLSFRPMSEIGQFRADIESGANPRDIKFKLAAEIVARFHDDKAAHAAQEEFIARFQKGTLPDDMPEVRITLADGVMPLGNVLKEAGLTKSTSEARRMVMQGAVRVDGERAGDPAAEFGRGASHVIQVGKRRFARVTLC